MKFPRNFLHVGLEGSYWSGQARPGQARPGQARPGGQFIPSRRQICRRCPRLPGTTPPRTAAPMSRTRKASSPGTAVSLIHGVREQAGHPGPRWQNRVSLDSSNSLTKLSTEELGVANSSRLDKIYIVVLFSQNTFLHLSLNYFFFKTAKINMIFFKKFNYQSGFVLKIRDFQEFQALQGPL